MDVGWRLGPATIYLLLRKVGRQGMGRTIQRMLLLRSIVRRGGILFYHRGCFYADDEIPSGAQALLFWLYVMA